MEAAVIGIQRLQQGLVLDIEETQASIAQLCAEEDESTRLVGDSLDAVIHNMKRVEQGKEPHQAFLYAVFFSPELIQESNITEASPEQTRYVVDKNLRLITRPTASNIIPINALLPRIDVALDARIIPLFSSKDDMVSADRLYLWTADCSMPCRYITQPKRHKIIIPAWAIFNPKEQWMLNLRPDDNIVLDSTKCDSNMFCGQFHTKSFPPSQHPIIFDGKHLCCLVGVVNRSQLVESTARMALLRKSPDIVDVGLNAYFGERSKQHLKVLHTLRPISLKPLSLPYAMGGTTFLSKKGQ